MDRASPSQGQTPVMEQARDGAAPRARGPSPAGALLTPRSPSRPHYNAVDSLSLIEQCQFAYRVNYDALRAWAPEHYERPWVLTKVLGQSILLVNDPDIVKHCFVNNERNFGRNPTNDALLRPILGEGLLTSSGETWTRTRKALAPVFTPRNIFGFAAGMRLRVEKEAASLTAKVGQTTDMFAFTMKLTNDVVLDTLFAGEQPLDRDLLVQRMVKIIWQFRAAHPFDLLRAPGWVPRWRGAGFHGLIEAFRSQVAELVAERRATPVPDRKTPVFMDLLLAAGLSDVEVIDNLITFLLTGHLTTARSLAWTLFLLSKDERVRVRVEEELDSAQLPDDPAKWIDHLPWMRAVIYESLRLYPPVVLIPRTTFEADRIDGLAIPAGTHILISTWVMHRHRGLWNQPDSFVPERFLGDGEKQTRSDTYLPFGVGRHVCIGMSFAMMEMTIVLALLLRRFRFQWARPVDPLPVAKPALTPDMPLDMMVRTRERQLPGH